MGCSLLNGDESPVVEVVIFESVMLGTDALYSVTGREALLNICTGAAIDVLEEGTLVVPTPELTFISTEWVWAGKLAEVKVIVEFPSL